MATPTGTQPAQQDSYGQPVVALAAAGAGTYTSQQLRTLDQLLEVVANITAISGTSPTLTVTIQGVDSASGQTFTVLVSAALTAVGITRLQVGPMLAAVANLSANAIVPRVVQIQAVIGGTTPSVTATIGYRTITLNNPSPIRPNAH